MRIFAMCGVLERYTHVLSCVWLLPLMCPVSPSGAWKGHPFYCPPSPLSSIKCGMKNKCISRGGTETWRNECISRGGTETWRNECISRGGTETWQNECISRGGTETWQNECISHRGMKTWQNECISHRGMKTWQNECISHRGMKTWRNRCTSHGGMGVGLPWYRAVERKRLRSRLVASPSFSWRQKLTSLCPTTVPRRTKHA